MTLWNIQHDAHVVTLTIDNPPVNALSQDALAQLYAHLQQLAHADTTPAVRAVILTGTGDKAFVAGANIKEINALSDASAGADFGMAALTLARYMRQLPFPIIAAVNGVAYGGGCELALMCDMRIASDHARLALPEVTLGLMPGWGGSVRVARQAGASTAMMLAMTGEPIAAPDALRLGLVDQVVPAAELLPTAQRLARRIASMSAPVVATIKSTIWAGVDMPLDDALQAECQMFATVVVDADAKEGTAAFLQKRAPQWSSAQ